MPPKRKTQEQLREEYRTTHPCPDCGMMLVKAENTLGHTPSICATYRVMMKKKAAAKAKKAAGKPANK